MYDNLPDHPLTGTSTPAESRQWWILAVCCLAQLMVVLDITVVNIALPSAQHSLGFSTADRQWVVTAYSLAFGSLMLFGGRLSDLFGRRRVLIIGMAGFASASAIAGAATGFIMLIAARAVQGAFGALLAPTALSQLSTTFSDTPARSKAFGIYGTIAAGGSAIGLILGGGLTQYLGWRWCMYVNILLAGAALVGSAVFLPRSASGRHADLDWPGTVTVAAALFGIVYGFSEASTRGWTDPLTLGLLAGGTLLLAVFVGIERQVPYPLLPLRILADRSRGTANLILLVSGIGMFGVFLFLSYYLQQVRRFSPIVSGFAFMPIVTGLVVTSAAASMLLPRLGPRWLVTVGMALAALGLLMFSRLAVGSTYLAGVVPGMVIVGAGVGLVFGTTMNVATHRVPDRDAGVASAIANVSQQVGGSTGTALLNTLAVSATATYLARHHLSGATQIAASVHGSDLAFIVAAAVFALGAVSAAILFHRGPLPADPHEPPQQQPTPPPAQAPRPGDTDRVHARARRRPG